MGKPDADHEYEISYSITQQTTDKKPSQVIQAFYDELRLQYGSTIKIDQVLVRDLKRPNEWAKRLDPPDKTYQEQRHDGDATEPEADSSRHPSSGLDIT